MNAIKWKMMLAALGVAVLGACGGTMSTVTNDTCQIMQNPPAPTQEAKDNANCPNSTDVYLSAVFDAGKPIGVGGGTDAGTGDKNDKEVQGGQNICWVATNKSGNASDQQFDILFSPSENVNANKNYQSINIAPHAAQDVPYKYTVWASESNCGFLDPRFLIN